MLSLFLALTLQVSPVRAGIRVGCRPQLWARLTSALDTNLHFLHLRRKLRRSRIRYGIPTIPSLEAAKPGQIVLVTAINCGPCIDWSLRFNTRARRTAGWSFVAYDFTQDWLSDDGQISSFLVVGPARRVQLTYPGHGGTRTFTDARLDEALALSAEAGPDLIWEVRRPREGRWVPARTTPARDAYMKMDLE